MRKATKVTVETLRAMPPTKRGKTFDGLTPEQQVELTEPCTGEAHSNAFIDNCMVCLHYSWGRMLRRDGESKLLDMNATQMNKLSAEISALQFGLLSDYFPDDECTLERGAAWEASESAWDEAQGRLVAAVESGNFLAAEAALAEMSAAEKEWGDDPVTSRARDIVAAAEFAVENGEAGA